jgi:hypothetical protein
MQRIFSGPVSMKIKQSFWLASCPVLLIQTALKLNQTAPDFAPKQCGTSFKVVKRALN